MKVTVKRVLPVRSGEAMLLTLTHTAQICREHTYRVSAEEYLAAGSPAEGEVLTERACLLLTEGEDERLAYARALRILAAGDNTRAALRRKLCERGFSDTAAEAATARLVEEGLLKEDELLLRQIAIYAKRLWGPKRFLPALLQKGFSREDIMAALVRAKEEGIYDAEEIKARLLSEFSGEDAAARRAWLYKHGF